LDALRDQHRIPRTGGILFFLAVLLGAALRLQLHTARFFWDLGTSRLGGGVKLSSVHFDLE
jgi:UDP-N-acetylmuramyl pentapeptide phosphotransferase/UDP-N-acetylglucosamine-1-phosphate transferase